MHDRDDRLRRWLIEQRNWRERVLLRIVICRAAADLRLIIILKEIKRGGLAFV